MRFFIHNGVRRALASLLDGRKTVPAIVYRPGHRPERRPRMRLDNPERRPRMRLDKLFTSKRTVERNLRFLVIVPPIRTPIEVEPLGWPGQPASIPLAKVRLK